jgi:hypothetical protein
MRPTYVSPARRKTEVRVNIILTMLLFLFPFIVIWVFWFATGMAFETRPIFNSGMYWFVTGIYEIMLFPPILIAIWDKGNRK